ncbi:hypothetical protein B4U79_07457 [Dinothrombium tinctorium]|uniref:BTB domain-containing protein n=1 Tax=Dinothrombium tinctorium TaxID=1965070 RepID=A0A443RRJ0_9ACAR|nr:hypothetical protein B4U79_07457 [Dinothrombium tinctorium]
MNDELISLNVGGIKFLTSRQTLNSIGDTFFTSLLSGRIPSFKDESGAIFIDRDPNLFAVILNYLRTRQLIVGDHSNIDAIKHEAEFYGISPLVKRLQVYDELFNKQTCGGTVLFQGVLNKREETQSNAAESDEYRVVDIAAQHNAVCIAYCNEVVCFKIKDSIGWQEVFKSERTEHNIKQIAFCYNYGSRLMIGLAFENNVISLWSLENSGVKREIGSFVLNTKFIDAIFFIGHQLVALGCGEGRVGIWQSTNQHWLVQDLMSGQSITAYDKATNNFLLLGTRRGSIYLIDMQKFPLRMKDNDLLINELYEDPDHEEITAISCYLTRTPKTNGNWIEIAYGTYGGTVRVLVQHPETVGHGPQLFQTFKVHLHPITNVMLSEKYLISVCSQMHVRTWMLTRFRGRISTQPGSTPHASFKIFKLEKEFVENESTSKECSKESVESFYRRDNIGPFGDQDDGDKQVFIEKLHSETNQIKVLMASNGETVCSLRSADDSLITAYCILECEAVAMVNRLRRYILTGHSNGQVQIWDLTTAFDFMAKSKDQCPKALRSEILKELFL